MKKILLVNERKEFENVNAGWPHLGLVSIGTTLKRYGFEVQVVDYAFINERVELEDLYKAFNPDIIGFSLYTTTWPKYDQILTEISSYSKAMVIVGGPHATLYYQDLIKDPRIDVIVTGEVEERIVEICNTITKSDSAKVIHCRYADIRNLYRLDYTVALQYEKAIEIGIQLERGCPFNCSFCSVGHISSRKVRYRNIDECIIEIDEALKVMPYLQTVRVIDDCPSFQIGIFKEFMQKFIKNFPNLRINIQHLRADQVDEEMLILLKKAHVKSLTLGVESANPEVFKFVDKGETLEQIEKAALMIKKMGIPVTLAFVLGLPLSDYKKEEDSLRFAKKIKPNEIYWNMCVPHKGTRVWGWFQEHGKIYPDRNSSTLIDFNLQFDTPCAEANNFILYERERSWVRAVLETKSFRFRFSLLPRIFVLGRRYHLMPSVGRLFLNLHNLKYMGRDLIANVLKYFGLIDIARNLKIKLIFRINR